MYVANTVRICTTKCKGPTAYVPLDPTTLAIVLQQLRYTTQLRLWMRRLGPPWSSSLATTIILLTMLTKVFLLLLTSFSDLHLFSTLENGLLLPFCVSDREARNNT